MPKEAADGRQRVVIERVCPVIDCGRFAAKRIVGEKVIVEADVFADGHVQVGCQILYWWGNEESQSSPMRPLGNNRWRGEFTVSKLGSYEYTVEAWIDRFQTWRSDLEKRVSAGQDVHVDLLTGAVLIERAATRATSEDATLLEKWAHRVREGKDGSAGASVALEERLLNRMQQYPELDLASRYERQFTVVVDREKAALLDLVRNISRDHARPKPDVTEHFGIARRGFPTLRPWVSTSSIFRPSIPSGIHFERERTIQMSAQPDDVGSPWAIGSEEGGHTSIHPQLGTLEDFRQFRFQSQGAWTGGGARYCVSVHAGPPLRQASIRNGSGRARTARYNMRRIRPRNIRTSTRSISKAPNGGRYGRN